MYAIIEDGAHQYKVEPGQRLDVQRRELDEAQTSIAFDRVMLVADGAEHKVGQPYLEGAQVTATIDREIKGDKLTTIKFRRRKASQTKKGHRQKYLRVRIDKIEV